jgi:hypothetical protein
MDELKETNVSTTDPNSDDRIIYSKNNIITDVYVTSRNVNDFNPNFFRLNR